MSAVRRLPQTAVEMRRAFDEGFRSAVERPRRDEESLIAIQAAGTALAVRVGQVRGISRIRHVLAIPTGAEGLLGITALRGAIVAVYDLAAVVGIGATASAAAWIMVAGDPQVALAFERFDGRVEVPGTAIHAAGAAPGPGQQLETVEIGSCLHAIIDVPQLLMKLAQPIAQQAGGRSGLSS